jgi:hypothetical protein
MTVYEVVMQVKLDLADDTPEAAERVIKNKLNEGEMYEEVCQVYAIRPIPKHEDLAAYEPKYKVGCLRNYYGPGAEDLEVLREAFRQYIISVSDAALQAVDRVIDDTVAKVLASRTNSGFVHKMMAAVKPNTEMQIHCKTHGEVMAFADGNKHLYCPECYNGALSKIEDIQVMKHLDRCVELAKGPYSMEAKSGKCEVTWIGRSREEKE